MGALAIAEFTAEWQAIRYPEEKPKSIRDLERLCPELEGVGHVADSDALAIDQHAYDVKTVDLALPPVTIDPRDRRARQFSLLAPIDRLHRITEVRPVPCFDFDEGDQPTALDNEIDVAPPRPETTLEDAPPCPLEPARGDTLSQDTKARSLLRHARRIGSPASPT